MFDTTSVKKIYIHENCPDGVASAIILNDVLPGREIITINYGTQEYKNLIPEEGMLFCDISPPSVEGFLSCGTIVLDHHISRKVDIMKFVDAGLGAFGDETDNPGVSGAVLAYQNIYVPLKGEHKYWKYLSNLAGIRDTWRNKSPLWQAACEQASALVFWPLETLIADRDNFEAMMHVGPILFSRQLESAKNCSKNGYRFDIGNLRVIVFQGPNHTSDTAELLGAEVDVVIGFGFLTENNTKHKMLFSVRSHTDFDCAKLSKFWDGGGHTKAAGFNIDITGCSVNPYQMAEEALQEFLTEEVQESIDGEDF